MFHKVSQGVKHPESEPVKIRPVETHKEVGALRDAFFQVRELQEGLH